MAEKHSTDQQTVAPAPDGRFQPMAKEDAAAFFRCCSERFGELYVLFDVIVRRVGKYDDLHKLARLGKDAAFDYENMAGCWSEQIENAGVKP